MAIRRTYQVCVLVVQRRGSLRWPDGVLVVLGTAAPRARLVGQAGVWCTARLTTWRGKVWVAAWHGSGGVGCWC